MTMYPCLVVSHSPVFVDQASSDSLIEENEETPEAEVQAVARRKLSRLASSVSVVAQWLAATPPINRDLEIMTMIMIWMIY